MNRTDPDLTVVREVATDIAGTAAQPTPDAVARIWGRINAGPQRPATLQRRRLTRRLVPIGAAVAVAVVAVTALALRPVSAPTPDHTVGTPPSATPNASIQVVIPAGKTAVDTFAILSEKTGIPVAEFQAAAKDPIKNLGIPDWWYKRGDGKPADVSVEGFLFPDTYSFQPEDTATDILKTMVNHFLSVAGDLKFADTVQAGLGGITPYEALIVASLAQVEVSTEAAMPQVARVAYNRGVAGLVECRCLLFDVSVHYWLQKQGKPAKASKDLTAQELDDPANPYNTGPNSRGLPLGPVSNPGQAALRGAMAPPAGKWIYFVAIDKNGTTKFSETQAQFDRDLAEACRNKVTC